MSYIKNDYDKLPEGEVLVSFISDIEKATTKDELREMVHNEVMANGVKFLLKENNQIKEWIIEANFFKFLKDEFIKNNARGIVDEETFEEVQEFFGEFAFAQLINKLNIIKPTNVYDIKS
jgi:hypothetical protein